MRPVVGYDREGVGHATINCGNGSEHGTSRKASAKKLASNSEDLPSKAPKRRPGEPLSGGFTGMETLIKVGYDPIHAAYLFVQQMSSHFADCVSQISEMKAWAKVVEKAEEDYVPSGPPMSPLTRSCIWMRALYDLRIGTDCAMAAIVYHHHQQME